MFLLSVIPSSKQYSDPYNDVLLDVEVSDPQGQKQLVPAYWAGSQTWKVRYGSHVEGLHTFRTISSDTANADLHVTGTANESHPQTIPSIGMELCGSVTTRGISLTPMARLSSGWETPGGLVFANASRGPTASSRSPQIEEARASP